MRIAIWCLGGLILLDLGVVSYFHVFRANHYFPDRYEEALQADFFAVLCGLPLLILFVRLLVKHSQRSGRSDVSSEQDPSKPK